MKAIVLLALSPAPVALSPVAARLSLPQTSVPALSAPLLGAPSLNTSLSPSLSAAAPLSPAPAKAFPALQALSVLPAPSVGDSFDGAFAERREKKAEAVQHARAEIPVVDWRRGAYSKELSAEMMDDEGRELLSYLVTPEALHPDLTPDPDRVDFSRLGRTSAQIREILEEKDVPYHPYERWLGAAFREGLIYRLFNKNTGLTYYGVPPQVRADWGLSATNADDAPVAAPKSAVPSEFALALARLAKDAESLPKSEELFEFTAQAVDAAIRDGVLKADAVSAKFRARADALGYDAPSLKDAVLTLSESAEGTPWEGRAAALAALLD